LRNTFYQADYVMFGNVLQTFKRYHHIGDLAHQDVRIGGRAMDYFEIRSHSIATTSYSGVLFV
jgi:hypothetical protein